MAATQKSFMSQDDFVDYVRQTDGMDTPEQGDEYVTAVSALDAARERAARASLVAQDEHFKAGKARRVALEAQQAARTARQEALTAQQAAKDADVLYQYAVLQDMLRTLTPAQLQDAIARKAIQVDEYR